MALVSDGAVWGSFSPFSLTNSSQRIFRECWSGMTCKLCRRGQFYTVFIITMSTVRNALLEVCAVV